MNKFYKAINKIVRIAAVILVLSSLLFSGFMIWDNNQIYVSAKNVKMELLDAKPMESEDGKLDFRKLLEINPDVKLWITLDGTAIDAPVVQGKDNYYYLNRDVFCKPSLAGSLYLDSRNASDFSDIYNIIYGHHMKGSLMFGDLDYYLDEEFFAENTTGSFRLPDSIKKFETLAVMQIPDSSKEIFRPNYYTDDLSELCTFIEENALHISPDAFAKLQANPDSFQVTALITCTDGYTGTRLVLLVMSEYVKPDKPNGDNKADNDEPNAKPQPEPKTGYNDHLTLWLCLLLASAAVFTASLFCLTRRKKIRR